MPLLYKDPYKKEADKSEVRERRWKQDSERRKGDVLLVLKMKKGRHKPRDVDIL